MLALPPDLKDVLVLAFMNPGTLAAGFLLGRRANEPQKIVVAGFAAGIAGVLFAYVLMLTGLFDPKVRLLGGVLVASGAIGLVWGWLGFVTRRPPDDGDTSPDR